MESSIFGIGEETMDAFDMINSFTGVNNDNNINNNNNNNNNNNDNNNNNNNYNNNNNNNRITLGKSINYPDYTPSINNHITIPVMSNIVNINSTIPIIPYSNNNINGNNNCSVPILKESNNNTNTILHVNDHNKFSNRNNNNNINKYFE